MTLSNQQVSKSLDISVDSVNFQRLAHLLPYQSGLLDFVDPNEKVRFWFRDCPFRNAGSLLPICVDHLHYETTLSEKERHVEPVDLQSLKMFLRKYGRPIMVKKMNYDKPIAIIYNPMSGRKNLRKKYLRKKILSTLTKHSIEGVIFETEHCLHAWEMAEHEIDLSQYCAIAVVGGDGTFHEVINGLMNRRDGNESVPIAFLPNGSGNDTLANFLVSTLEEALDFIIKGELINIDCNLVTFDADTDIEVPEEQRRNRVRYSIANSALGFVAKVNKKASALKNWIGGAAYSAVGIKELVLNRDSVLNYNVVMELPNGSKIELSDLETSLLFVNNGKYAGGHTSFTPGAMLNDGLLDVVFKEGNFRIFEALKIIGMASRQQGMQVFQEDIKSFRAKSIRIELVDRHEERDFRPGCRQMYQVDGENLDFSQYVKIVAVPEALNVIVDFEKVMLRSQMIE